MATATFYIKENDTLPEIQATLQDGNGTAVNLTGTTVKFSMRDVQTQTVKINEGSVTLVDAANGICKYTWVTGDTDTPGRYMAEFEVTDGSSNVETYPNSDANRLFVVIEPEIA